jgi:hypothetical protein
MAVPEKGVFLPRGILRESNSALEEIGNEY